MNEKRRLKPKELLMVLLPVLILAGLAIGLRVREGATKATPSGEFGFKVDEVKFKRLLSPTTKNWRMEVTVYVGFEGTKPTWWGQPGTALGALDKMRFMDGKGKVALPQATSGGGGPFDESRQQYIIQHIVNTGKNRSLMRPAKFIAVVLLKDWTSGRPVNIPISQVIKDS